MLEPVRGSWVSSAIAVLAAVLAPSGPVRAHGPAEAAATLLDPDRSGVVVSDAYTFRWADLGTGSALGSGMTTQRFYFGRAHVAPWYPWSPPPPPAGELIVDGIPDTDPANRYTWDTRAVPAGAYWLFSLADDPDLALPDATLRFAPYPVVVARAGDPIAPTIVLLEPDNGYDHADDRFEIVWSAFDPDGTGRVTLEAASSTNAASRRSIARDLPAAAGRHTWDTRDVPEGDYILEATLEDARGFRFSAFARYFLLVTRLPIDGLRPDAGVARDGSAVDAGPRDAGTGDASVEPAREAPACAHGPRRPGRADGTSSALVAIAFLGGLALRRRHRRAGPLRYSLRS